MTNKEIVKTLDDVGVMLFDIDIKGKQAMMMTGIFQRLNTVRNEIEKRDDPAEKEVIADDGIST